jgi:hypothetical protein
MLEATAEKDRTAAAIEVARIVDAETLESAIAALDRAIAAAPAQDPIRKDLDTLRVSLVESARVVALPAAGQGSSARSLAPLPTVATFANGSLPTYSAFAVTDRAVPLLAAWSLGAPTRARRADPDAVTTTLRPIARDLIDEIGALGLLRAPLPDAPWSEGLAFEERLMASVDALSSLAEPTTTGPGLDVVAIALEHALDWPVPEPARVFTVALLFSLSSLYAALAALAALVRAADARTSEAIASAIALGSHPDLDRLIEGRILDETRPAALALWLDVARRRRAVPKDALDLLAHPDPHVEISAARAAVLVDPTNAAPELVGRLGSESVLSVTAATTLAVFGAQAGPQHLRQLVLRVARTDAAFSELGVSAALALALLGDPRDASTLVAWVAEEAGALGVLAWHGHPSFIPLLLARMESTDTGMRSAATTALARMVVPIDRIREADPQEVRELASHHLTSSAPRLRYGEAHKLEIAIDELARTSSLSAARRTSWIEASIFARRPIPLDLDDWVSRQKRVLESLAPSTRTHEATR